MKGAMPDRVTTSPMRPGGAGGRGGSTGREVPCPPRPAPPLPRSAPPRAAPAAPLQHARRMLASCSGRKGPEGRYPLHYLVWHNRARDLDRELSAKQVGRRRGGHRRYGPVRLGADAMLPGCSRASARGWNEDGDEDDDRDGLPFGSDVALGVSCVPLHARTVPTAAGAGTERWVPPAGPLHPLPHAAPSIPPHLCPAPC